MERFFIISFITLVSVACAPVSVSKKEEASIASSKYVVLNKNIKATYCIPDEAAKLIGQHILNKEQLKEITNSGKVRISNIGEFGDADFQSDRLSIVIDPYQQIIQYASCG